MLLAVFFAYNMAVIGLAVGVSFVSVYVWFIVRRRDTLDAAVGFAAYALMLALIFFDKFALKAGSSLLDFDQALPHPVLMGVLAVAVVGCCWIWVVIRTHAELTRRVALVPLAIFAAGCFALTPFGTTVSLVHQWLYWLWRDLGLAACLAFAAWRYAKKATELERLDMQRSIPMFKACCALVALVVVEDTWTVLIWQRAAEPAWLSDFLWCFSGRDLTETVLMVACAAHLLKRYHDVLIVFAQHPQEDPTGAAEGKRPAVSEDNFDTHVVIFGDSHGLSAREREVLSMLLCGQDIQGIAAALVVSQSTVKTHLHRVYTKVGVSGKDELIREFWRW